MTTIGGKNDLPDFSAVRPFVRPEDLAGLNEAIARFESTLGAFNGAVGDAEKTVSLTMAWIGVGEKLLSLASAIVQKWPARSEEPAQPPASVRGLASRLGRLSSLCASLAKSLPVTAA
jgi:hypothetical protein